MSESSHDVPPEVLFRANKRRRVIRKRFTDDPDESTAMGPQEDQLGIGEQELKRHLPTVRRHAARKHGIGFSSASSQQPVGPSANSETALVPCEKDEDEAASNDRFTKPTGKAEVVEDKHLTAYIETKLAELRSSTSIPTITQEARSTAPDTNLPSSSSDAPKVKETPVDDVPRNYNPRKNTRRATNRRPRPQQPKDASELAREAMIEQILGESQVPMYDQSSSAICLPSDTGVDNDEAAAEAFKAEFILEKQNRRRPAAASAAAKAAVKGAPVLSRPKLGGSRAQREKMRAIEEAKNAGGAAKR